MSKHTAGKWVVHRGEICYRSTEDDQSYGMLCPVDLSDESNQNLISAAPELLEALQRCRFDSLNMSFEDMRFIHAAIAKATGGE